MSYHVGPSSDEGLSRQFGTEICSKCNEPLENCECCLEHGDPECEVCD